MDQTLYIKYVSQSIFSTLGQWVSIVDGRAVVTELFHVPDDSFMLSSRCEMRAMTILASGSLKTRSYTQGIIICN